MVKFDQLTSELAPNLHKRLQTEYAYNEGNFRHLFDDMQVSAAIDRYRSKYTTRLLGHWTIVVNILLDSLAIGHLLAKIVKGWTKESYATIHIFPWESKNSIEIVNLSKIWKSKQLKFI
jgi:hypothetical protein